MQKKIENSRGVMIKIDWKSRGWLKKDVFLNRGGGVQFIFWKSPIYNRIFQNIMTNFKMLKIHGYQAVITIFLSILYFYSMFLLKKSVVLVVLAY